MTGKDEVFIDFHDRVYDRIYSTLHELSGATIYHTKPWHELLRKNCGWPVRALVASSAEDQIHWFLPVVVKYRFGFGQISVCLPLSDRVGPAVRPGFHAQALRPIANMVGPLEIHEATNLPGLRKHATRFTSALNLAESKNVDDVLALFHKASIVRKIRKAERTGLTVRRGLSAEDFRIFEIMQNATRRRQGSLAYPKNFFPQMWEEFRDVNPVSLHLVYYKDKPVSGVLFLRYKDQAIYGYGASICDRSIWRQGANQLAMWSAIRTAYNEGCKSVDFGSTPRSQPDLRQYKEKWGAKSRNLFYGYVGCPHKSAGLSRTGFSVNLGSRVVRMLPRPIFDLTTGWLIKRVT